MRFKTKYESSKSSLFRLLNCCNYIINTSEKEKYVITYSSNIFLVDFKDENPKEKTIIIYYKNENENEKKQ